MKNKNETTESESNITVHVGGNAIGNAIGSNASVKSTVISGGNVNQDNQINKLFGSIYAAIDARPTDQTVDKEEIIEVVQELFEEARKANQADEDVIKRRLRSIRRMAPDILDVIIETIKNPVSGLLEVIRKIALKVKQETQR